MRFQKRHLLWVVPLLLAALIVALGVLADSWLESAGGRQMLQTELNKTVGMPVRLKGDYSLKLFPRLKIAGQNLEIGEPGSPGALALGEEYSAVVELAPFIHRQVKISSIHVQGGFLDLGLLPKDSGDERKETLSQVTFPQVASLEIGDFLIRRQSEERSILVDHLLITDFHQGRPALLDLRARLLDLKSEVARMSMHGELTLAAGDLPSHLDIDKLTLDWDMAKFEGLSGAWAWDPRSAQLTGQMMWEQAAGSADSRLDLHMGPEPSGSLLVHYLGPPLPEPASLGIDFFIHPGQIGFSQLDAVMGDQSLSGSGCLVFADLPTLNLSLQAEALDLDKLYSIGVKPQAGAAEFPLQLALELRVERAWFAGAEAAGLVVATGPEPDCPGMAAKE